MIDHISIKVTDYPASREFFTKALAPLGLIVAEEDSDGCGYGTDGRGEFWISGGERHVPLHLAFVAHNREQVRAFHRAALEAGGRDNGAPGLRTRYSPDYYAAFVYGPDGHNVEAVCRAPGE